MNKTFLFFCISLFLVGKCKAQSGSNNARIINAMAGEFIGVGTLEIEPNVTLSSVNGSWNDDGDLRALNQTDTTSLETTLSFRFNYSPISNLEVGMNMPVDGSQLNLGAKYALLDTGNTSIVVFTNQFLNTNQRPLDTDLRSIDQRHSSSLGIGFSHDFSPDFIVDLSGEYQIVGAGLVNETNDLFLFLDAAYRVSPGLLFFNSFGYQVNKPNLIDSSLFTIYPGFTIDSAERHVVQLNGQFDLLGQNAIKTAGANMALTLLFN